MFCCSLSLFPSSTLRSFFSLLFGCPLMAGYLFAYFNFSSGEAFPAPHLVDIRGSSWPLPVLPIPVPVFFPCSLLLSGLCCSSALTAMVTSKRHGHLIYQEKEKSSGMCACECMCQGRDRIILFLSLLVFRFKAFHYSCWEEAIQLAGAGRGGGTGAMCPVLLPVSGQGMLGCSLSPAPGFAAMERKRGSNILKV